MKTDHVNLCTEKSGANVHVAVLEHGVKVTISNQYMRLADLFEVTYFLNDLADTMQGEQIVEERAAIERFKKFRAETREHDVKLERLWMENDERLNAPNTET